MSDTVQYLIGEYTLEAVLAACLFAVIVWLLAHFYSAPGTTVRILWGLAEYTKRTPSALVPTQKLVGPKRGSAATSSKPEVNAKEQPRSIVHFASTKESATSKVLQIRKNWALRELLPVEDNLPVTELPAGTYFFLSTPDVYDSKPGELNRLSSGRKKSDNLSFEVHRRKGEENLVIVFLSEPEARRLEGKRDGERIEIVATATPWAGNTCVAEIPVSAIATARSRVIEFDEGNLTQCLDLAMR